MTSTGTAANINQQSRFSFAACACACVILSLAACQRTETSSAVTSTTPSGSSTAPAAAAATHRDEALVRMVHAVPLPTSLDVFAGDLVLFDGLAFKAVTPYRAVDGQRHAFALRPAGMTQAKPLSSNTEGLAKGHYYTAIAMPGEGREPDLRIVNDPLDKPAAGKARLRIIHAGVDAGRVDIRGANGLLAEDVDFKTITNYRDVDPVDGTVDILTDGQDGPLASFRTHLEAGRFYTIVIVGNARSDPRLEAFLIEDALSP
ncbi:MAG TPA: DUF4397 domain-containing protein [Vicinamibacterales bacterium]|nr:DUF4397 domain-containing protein [Vicinamibacterales bacterium]